MLRSPRCVASEDNGAVLVLWTVALFAVMGLTAMAIDLGNIAQTKQHTVDAVQSAALAGAPTLQEQFSGGKTALATEADAATEAVNYLVANYPSVTVADMQTGCSTSVFPIGITPDTTYSCVGFFTTSSGGLSPNGIAVAIPTRTVNYTFGRAAGSRSSGPPLVSQGVSSVAYATIETASRGLLLPFALSASDAPGLNCLLDFSNGGNACAGNYPSAGDRGATNNPRYSVVTYSGGSYSVSRKILAPVNVNLGLDHPLNQYTSGGEICDWPPGSPACTGGTNNTAPYNQANAVRVTSGNTGVDLTGPLFTGIPNFSSTIGNCNLQARFNHVDGFIASNSACGAPSSTPSGPDLNPSNYSFCSGNACPDLNGRHISYYLQHSAQRTCRSYVPGGGTPGISGPAGSDAVDDGGIPTKSSDTNLWMETVAPNDMSFDQCLSTQIVAAAATCSYLVPLCTNPMFSGSTPRSDPNYASDSNDLNIEASPRFGLVPIVSACPPPCNGTYYPTIQSFAGVYLDLAYPNTRNSLDSIQAWVFPLGLIDGTSTIGPGLGGYYGGNYVTNLCVYGSSC